jgi:hypothetical protein
VELANFLEGMPLKDEEMGGFHLDVPYSTYPTRDPTTYSLGSNTEMESQTITHGITPLTSFDAFQSLPLQCKSRSGDLSMTYKLYE